MNILQETQKLVDRIDNADDIKKVWDMLKSRLTYLDSHKINEFSVGERVKFMGARGRDTKGKITKINRSTINVKDDEGKHWKVYPSALEVI